MLHTLISLNIALFANYSNAIDFRICMKVLHFSLLLFYLKQCALSILQPRKVPSNCGGMKGLCAHRDIDPGSIFVSSKKHSNIIRLHAYTIYLLIIAGPRVTTFHWYRI